MGEVIRLYVGHDPRETVGTHVFIQSVLEYTTRPTSITPLYKPMLKHAVGDVKEGTNQFTLSRFLIPHLEGYKGWAIFADGADMLCRGDLYELAQQYDPWKAVQVVRHSYATKHPRKYVGTAMESENKDYPRKNWASLMLINCGHFAWRKLTPEYLRTASPLQILSFDWLHDSEIGDLSVEWNWLADEYGENRLAKLVHWTAGVPGFEHYKDAPHADEWRAMQVLANGHA
jgi:hypothetical protein